MIDAATLKSATAYVNYGRWVIDCPRCNSGMLVSETFAQCPECKVGVDVRWPERALREWAEGILSKRPRDNRNWYPDREGIEDLKAENLMHGIEF